MMNPRSRERLAIMAFAIAAVIINGAGLVMTRCNTRMPHVPEETVLFSADSLDVNRGGDSLSGIASTVSGASVASSDSTAAGRRKHRTRRKKASAKSSAKQGAKATPSPASPPRDYLRDTIRFASPPPSRHNP